MANRSILRFTLLMTTVMLTVGWVLVALLILPVPSANAQTMAALQGRVVDASGAALPGASVAVRDPATGFASAVVTDDEGRYHLPAIPVGIYRVVTEAPGFRTVRIDALTFEVGRTLVRDFELAVDTRLEAVVVSAELPLLDRATSVVGHVVSAQTVQEIPLNGRHFVDLGPLVPGSLAPSQTGFSTTPIRGTGALAFQTAGNREEAVGYIINGVSTTNMAFGSISFPPPVASIQEFKIDNSTFSAEYGHVSGAINFAGTCTNSSATTPSTRATSSSSRRRTRIRSNATSSAARSAARSRAAERTSSPPMRDCVSARASI
jgi:hypothetical protein